MDGIGALPRGLPRDAVIAEVDRCVGDLPSGARVVVGASGGPDSAALLLLLAEARPDLRVTAVHVRHGLRPDAEDVAAFGAQVAFAASQVGAGHAGFVDARVIEVEVVEDGDGPEAAARAARHAALGEAARAVGAVSILLGHTADDQAETVLLRLARGSGARGLGGMTVWRPFALVDGVRLGRPMLRLRRQDVRSVVPTSGLAVASDPSNVDRRFARSHLRATVLPDLGVHAGDPVGALARAAHLLREDADALDGWAASVVAASAVPFGPVVSLPDATMAELPVAVRRRVIRAVASSFGASLDAATVGALLALEPGQAWDAGGLRASRGGGWLALAPTGAPTDAPTDAPTVGRGHREVVTLAATPVGGAVHPAVVLPGGRPDRASLAIDAALAERFEVRTRRPGDRIRTAGGTRSVQDLFVDAGVPRLVRDLVPLLIDPTGDSAESVVWVPGLDADPEVVAAGRRSPAVTLCLAPG